MKVLEVYTKKLRYLGYSENSIKSYTCYLKEFLIDTKDPYQVSTKQIELYLLEYNYSSISKQNQIIGSLKLFAREILGKSDLHLNKIKRPRKEKKLPKIIDAELLVQNINAIPNIKHKTALALGLSCGLRVSETINLKWEHLDRNRNILNVINGKGKRDRCCPLNYNMIKLLEDYWMEYKSVDYVFNGQNRPKYSATSMQKLVKKYISKKATYHFLRHSYATYALENGTGIEALAPSMGHKSTKTTEIYYHVSNKTLKLIKQAI